MTTFSLRRVAALLVKESFQIVRDPATLLIAFMLPPLLLFLFGYAINLDTARTRIGLAQLDGSEAATGLATAFERSRWFEIRTASSVSPLAADLVAGRIRGLVVIPADFGRVVATEGGEIQVITDGSLPNTASFIAAYAEGIRANWALGRTVERGQRAAAGGIDIATRFWFNPELSSRYFLVPGSMAIVLTIIGTLLTALIIAREWERGTMESLLATPVSMTEFLATKVIPYYLLGLGSALVCTLLAVGLFGVPFRGSPGALFLIVSAFMVPALGQGLFISAATKSQFVASQIALLTAFLPAMLLSGFLYEISSMPAWVQAVTYAVPVRYLVPLLQTVFLAGDVWSVFLPGIAAMLGFGALFFLATIKVTRRQVA